MSNRETLGPNDYVPPPGITNVMANVRAFLDASSQTSYSPEDLSEILYYHPVTVAEAMWGLGLMNRREFERRASPTGNFAGERRLKERRSFSHSWGSFF